MRLQYRCKYHLGTIEKTLHWFYLGHLHDLLAVWGSIWTGLLGVDNVLLLHAGFYVRDQPGLCEGTPVPSGTNTWEKSLKCVSFSLWL